MKIDQNGAINPDVNTPFLSKRDACKRLVRYHCLNEQVLSSKDLAKADEMFEETAKHLLSKFNSMMNKYTYLLLMESMVKYSFNSLSFYLIIINIQYNIYYQIVYMNQFKFTARS